MKLTSPVMLLVLLAVAGCGSGSDDSFTEDYNKAVRPLSELQTSTGTDAAQFDKLAQRTGETRDNLADLDPPEDAQDEMDKMLAGLERVTQDLTEVADAVRSKDPVKQQAAAKQLVKSSAEVQQAETALQQAVEG
jgi:methionine synthase II (cobalamin-independent)